ncbi:MAG: L-2-amino-thiazoline-4-carboxylic acid hydrolase [Candidatus Hermodarchaeota archaeon]
MKVFRSGELMPNALELEVEIQAYTNVKREALKRLNFILGFVADQNPGVITKYIENLQTQYQKLVQEDLIKKFGIRLDEIIDEFDHLQRNPELARLSLNFYLQNLQLPENINWIKEKVNVVNQAYLHSFLLPRYYNLVVLIETIGREEAIRLYKRYITCFLIERRKTHESDFVDLETLFENRIKPQDKPSEWVIVHVLLNEGKYAYRNDNCTWVDALKELPDVELKYLVCCYGDYEGAKMRDESLILTMEHTIAQGDPYCSRVLHDTRVDYDLRHPPKEFWDNLRPEGK